MATGVDEKPTTISVSLFTAMLDGDPFATTRFVAFVASMFS